VGGKKSVYVILRRICGDQLFLKSPKVFFESCLALVSLITIAVACTSKESLNPLDQVIANNVVVKDVNVTFCTDPAYVPEQYLKMVIVLDHSGSNKLNYKMAPDGSPLVTGGTLDVETAYATDPTGTTRYGTVATAGTLLNYLDNLPANSPTDPTKFFALVDFNSTVDTYPTNSSGFTSDIPAFYSFVAADAIAGGTGPDDVGETDYIGALTAAYNIINADIASAANCAGRAIGSASPGAWCPVPGVAVSSSYVVVFMSDGAPITALNDVTVNGGTYTVGPNFSFTMESQDQIIAQVATIEALTQNAKYVTSVNLFTIYYYNPLNIDSVADSLLSKMAKAGQGISYDALSGTNIDYTKFQPPQKRIKYTLADIFVTNASVTWWDDGLLHKDTDMDGLPDDIETAWGSDPAKPSTQNNGVTDLVRYRLANGAACSGALVAGLCPDAPINYKTGICNGITHTTVAGVLTFKSSDPDGLNDCEKLALNDAAGINDPDSNADLIPDWLEFMAGIPFQTGTQPATNQPDPDGLSIYDKVKYSLPQNVSAQQELNLTPSSYNLQLVSSNNTQDCYTLNVSNLPFIGDNNMVRVDVVEKSQLLNEDYLYKVGKKAFATGVNTVNFNDWTDAGEIALGTWSQWP
jgi:hypothetical protein